MSRRKGQRKKTQQRKKNPSGGQQVPRRKRDGSAAIRGMLVGGAIVLALALFFFVKIGGATGFNHVVGIFVSDAPEEEARDGKKTESTPTTAPQTIRLNGPQSKGIGTSSNPVRIQNRDRSGGAATTPTTNFEKASPMETVTDEDQKSLDETLKGLAR